METKFKFGRAGLMTGTGLALMLMAAPGAYAQDDDNTAEAQEEQASEDTIIVTGIRRSLTDSIAAKKNSSSIVEAVSAEDIGKLPDVSIAESLARLPGLTAQRLNGRGQVISVRGLAPDFTTALLNGREQLSTSDNRSVEFDQYPSELIQQVVIYKTPDAALIGQGLAGTADLRTVRPLEQNGRTIAFNLRGETNEYGALNSGTEDTGYRFSAAYFDQSANGEWGWALGYASTKSPSQGERYNAWGYPNLPADFDASTPLILGGAKPYVQSNELKRDGLIGVLQYEPSETFSSTLDAYYSEFEETQTLRGIELPLFWGGINPDPGYTVEDGLVTSGTFDGVVGVVRNDLNQRDAELFSIGWNTQTQLSDNWALETDIARSTVDRTDMILETYAGTGYNLSGPRDTLGFVTSSSGTVFDSILDYSDPNLIVLTSPQGWGTDAAAGRPNGQAGFLNMPSIEDELTSLRASMTREMTGPISSVEFGVNYSDRSKEKVADELFILLANGAAELTIPSNLLLEPTDLDYLGLGPMVSFDPLAALNSGIYDLDPNTNADVVTKSWTVEEQLLTVYAMANVDTMAGPFPLSGNFGVQVIQAEQSSTGAQAAGFEPNVFIETVEDGTEYTEFYPSANFQFELTDNTFLRTAVARTVARPRMDQMRASVEVSRNEGNIDSTDPNNAFWSAFGGNPQLEPWTAWAYDLSLERYFGTSGYVSAALFYKDLENYIYDQGEVFDFGGLPPGTDEEPATTLGLITRPANGEGGSIYGLEIAGSITGEMIHPVLDGFGVIASASFTESEIEPNGPGTDSSLPGLSETVANLTLYYEKNGFQARISDRYRSDFLGEVSGFGNGRDYTTVEAESVIDAQLGYDFQDGPLAGLGLLFQVQNLTDQEFVTFYNEDERQVRDFQQYGRTYLFGIDYKFN
ncbi:TonB-dependent receptor [Aquisalinus flavus]|uniref:TonB-dependent receptor n=1 Tax=Aquisalinus flavus TaxID=1526572 RepID=A0A8J2V3P4_9PROT|nr:TonB-dependent receptor [Aquisalinus flavus]MBD0427073.1 TonB-dependent receptor [Aquisalinus flavus]UNE46898.1 TonB-dependent receptor [Aquisalinus flavus]GGC98165.1 TonB-dependent receptor [Aquisalinus flavus]